jgi:hypothetical protein
MPKSKSWIDVLRNEPSIYTGLIKGAVFLAVGLGYLSQNWSDTVAVILTAVVMALLTYIDRANSVGPVTHEEAVGK